VGESERPILGELNPLKNSKISRRNHEISTNGLGGALMVVLENDKSEK
jgi:hypothetical protein